MKISIISFAILASCLILNGCKSQSNIQVIETDNNIQQPSMASGFSDMNFIWEGWLYSTNRVETTK